MNLLVRTLVKYWTAYRAKPAVPPIPQQANDPGKPQRRVDNVEIPQTFNR